jgi:hypothetical protein
LISHLSKYLFLFWALVFIPCLTKAQSIPVNPISFDETIRDLQLGGNYLSNSSLTIRPILFTKKNTLDSLYHLMAAKGETPLRSKTLHFLWNVGRLSVLPVEVLSKYNSHHPYGWNDAAMIPAKGFQSIVSTGLYSEIGPLAIQLNPAYIYAENNTYELTKSYGSSPTGIYKKYLIGQSSVRLNGGPISIGISNENLWWGPGKYSSLMMSNNAPGFLHMTFNSRKPLKTPIGLFEWQVIGGRLEDEKNIDMPLEIRGLRSYRKEYGSSSRYQGDWKYINAMIFTYQPTFLKGVSIGFSRQFSGLSKSVLNNSTEQTFASKYLPVFGKLFKSKLQNDDSKSWNQLADIFLRAVMPKSHAEFYLDYGWNDHSYNERDFIMNPSHSASFIVGAQKRVELRKSVWLNLSGEVTHMEQTPDYLVRWAGSWYEHYQGTGYTNANQILGAGAGFGSNSQVFSVAVNKGYKKIGILLERVQRAPNTHTVRWSELSYGIIGQYKFDGLLLSWRLSGVDSKNYGWKQDLNRFNFIGMLSARYYL